MSKKLPIKRRIFHVTSSRDEVIRIGKSIVDAAESNLSASSIPNTAEETNGLINEGGVR